MANLRDVRLRMRAIQQTLQVTKAMNLISASKLRRGRRVLEDTTPFFSRIQKTMCDIVAGAGMIESRFFEGGQVTAIPEKSGPSASAGRETRRSAVLAVTSDKGLAGGYNANIFREVNGLCEKLNNPVLILSGAVGYRYFIHSPHLILENFSFNSRLPSLDEAGGIADFIISQYLWGMFDEVHIVYTHMYSAVKLLPVIRHILPLSKEKMQTAIAESGEQRRVELQFEYLPSEEAVFDFLVPMYIKGIIYGCLVEAYAAEQSARMAAMDDASKNAEEMLASLRLSYNRARQAGITQEVTEIVSGSAALGA
ncbi:MAG: ATP synthase F1 subunit gamma [Treponema sp.]|jgi:F-type H+-transporting ATPase subunit gamma|nr:ATP synthase F1 subunit gamma [Treponema sp.]